MATHCAEAPRIDKIDPTGVELHPGPEVFGRWYFRRTPQQASGHPQMDNEMELRPPPPALDEIEHHLFPAPANTQDPFSDDSVELFEIKFGIEDIQVFDSFALGKGSEPSGNGLNFWQLWHRLGEIASQAGP